MTGLSLAPSALAEAAYPPTGKYLRMATGTAVWYDSVTKVVTDLEETVSPYECFEGQPAPGPTDGQCGNCLYVPNGASTWEVEASQYTFGRCVSVDAYAGSLAHTFGVARYRIDVRVETAFPEAYYNAPYAYEVWAIARTCASPDCEWVGTGQIVAPTVCPMEQTITGSYVHFCGGVPRNGDVRGNTWFQWASYICYHVNLYRFIDGTYYNTGDAATKSCEVY